MVEPILCQQPYFAEGRFRYVYKGRRETNRTLWLAVKVFKKGCPMEVGALQPDLDVYKRTHDLARRWNREVVGKVRGAQAIHYFTPAPYLHPTDDPQGVFHRNQWSIEEKFIHGHYQKFNSNAGWESEDYPTIGAFSHWTYETTKHKYMVCDLQGVHLAKCRPRYFRLTDACVHSFGQEHREALTDLGVVGMEMVLAGHSCGSLCRALKLRQPSVPRDLARPARFTHFSSSTDLSAEELRRARNGRSDFVRMDALVEEDEDEDVEQLSHAVNRVAL